MKTLKTILVVVAVLGTFMVANAQRTVVKTYPRQGTVVTTIYRPTIVVHKNRNFYYSDGIWYSAKGRNYVVCAAPVGIRLATLPRGSRVVYVNGRRLYNYNGIWYKRTGRHYMVVTV
ncbi:DUF6515 family protein [Flagellimonas iocasae]|uniref:DUF6515 family protein n=1 Tax=Flagellimonas iocasae TaxID=2055905 RepID=A0ABW4XT21_9FLAO